MESDDINKIFEDVYKSEKDLIFNKAWLGIRQNMANGMRRCISKKIVDKTSHHFHSISTAIVKLKINNLVYIQMEESIISAIRHKLGEYKK